jgi:uncharacterized protein YjbJ (UPF0337 family)
MHTMADTPESATDLKGRVKEAAGTITGDGETKREGQIEQAEEKVKAGIDKLADKAKDLLHRD